VKASFALCNERFALWGLHSGLSGITEVFGPVQAFVLLGNLGLLD
jgi:hypothetical protein